MTTTTKTPLFDWHVYIAMGIQVVVLVAGGVWAFSDTTHAIELVAQSHKDTAELFLSKLEAHDDRPMHAQAREEIAANRTAITNLTMQVTRLVAVVEQREQ